MRKRLFCVLMMTLLLTGCGGTGVSEGEQLALTIRGEFLAAQGCSATAEITADYGQRVYQYTMEVSGAGEEMTLTLTAPDTVAGITARLKGEDSLLEYEELVLETGPLNPAGLTPVSAVPALLEAVRSGYITCCTLEEECGLLRVDCGDPEGTAGSGTEISLWFEANSHQLRRGEIRDDGFRVIDCVFTDFTNE